MLKKICVLVFSMLLHGLIHAQQNYISGKTVNEQGLPLAGVLITIDGSGFQVNANESGFFRGVFDQRKRFTLKASLDGYAPVVKTIVMSGDSLELTLTLFTLSRQLDEINVKDHTAFYKTREMALNTLTVKRDFLLRNLGGSLMKSLERLPGVKTIGIGSGQSKPLIRGMGFNRVLVTDKGIKHEGQQWGADHGLEIDQFAAGEVEVIKGAASFAYGSDAIGGVVDIRPEQIPAMHTLEGSVDLTAKSNNALYGTSVNLMGRKDRWFVAGRATYQNYGDYVVPTNSLYTYDFKVDLPGGRMRNTAGRELGIHFNGGYIGQHFRSVIYLSDVNLRSGFFANAHGLEPRRVDVALHDASRRDILNPRQQVNHLKLINRTDIFLPHHTLRIDAGYQHNFRQEFSPYVNHGYMPPIYPATLGIPSDLEREFDKQVYSLNVKHRVLLARHELSFGVSAEYQQNNINGWSFLVPAFQQLAYGTFIYDQYKVSQQVMLHAAIRYDYAQLNINQYKDWFTTPLETASGILPGNLTRANALTRNFNSLVYAAGINVNGEKFSLKANLGKSFRMPIAKELGANGVNYHYFSYEKGNATLSPEVSYQLDLGLQYVHQSWSVSFNPYYNYFTNYIYLNSTPDHDYAYGAGNQIFDYRQSRVQRYGAELELKGKLSQNLSTEVVAEYLEAWQLSGDKKRYTLPFSPPPSVLFNLTYTGDISAYLRNAYLSADYRLTASQNEIVPPEKKTPGYSLIHLQAGATLGKGAAPISVRVQVQNLLNTRYLNHTSFYRLINLPEQGRNLVFSLNIPFKLKSKSHE